MPQQTIIVAHFPDDDDDGRFIASDQARPSDIALGGHIEFSVTGLVINKQMLEELWRRARHEAIRRNIAPYVEQLFREGPYP